MGSYLNPGNALFKMAVNSQIFVDKSMLIDVTNRYLNTMQRFICVSSSEKIWKVGGSRYAGLLIMTEVLIPLRFLNIWKSAVRNHMEYI